MQDLGVQYGAFTALHDVSLTVSPGLVSYLVGPNGAGKTSLISAITGAARATGAIYLNGSLLPSKPYQRARLGIIRSFQELRLLPTFTIWEQILAAPLSRGLSKIDAVNNARSVVEQLKITELASRHPSELPYGQQKLVSIARVLACSPKVMLYDEPLSGLSDEDIALVINAIRENIRPDQICIVVEHNLPVVREFGIDIIVLHNGELIARGTSSVLDSPAVIHAYYGDFRPQQQVSSESVEGS
jgi:branched-chain amino acid transport system permease protein